MAEPRFSILMPTHNREDVVGLAIQSVLAQTEPDFELLVVGDGCTDGTADVVASFGDPRIRWMDMPKAPAFGYANRNIALREARGSLIGFAAHDDLMFADHLERMLQLFADPAVEWAYSRPLWIEDDGRIVPFVTDLRKPSQLSTFLNAYNTIPASCIVYRASVHDRAGWWPEDSPGGGDLHLWRRMIGSEDDRHRLAYDPVPTALHFRANWVPSPWGPRPLPRWMELAKDEEWPDSLRVAVAEGELPQKAVWDAMCRDAADWTSAVRAAVGEATDFIALRSSEQVETVEEDLREAESQAADLGEAVASQKAADATAELNGAVARSLGSRSRRLLLALRGNPLFDADWYSAQNDGVSVADARRHWKTHGAREMRDPNPYFRTRAYLERYPDVRASGTDPLDHYFVFGMLEGRTPR